MVGRCQNDRGEGRGTGKGAHLSRCAPFSSTVGQCLRGRRHRRSPRRCGRGPRPPRWGLPDRGTRLRGTRCQSPQETRSHPRRGRPRGRRGRGVALFLEIGRDPVGRAALPRIEVGPCEQGLRFAHLFPLSHHRGDRMPRIPSQLSLVGYPHLLRWGRNRLASLSLTGCQCYQNALGAFQILGSLVGAFGYLLAVEVLERKVARRAKTPDEGLLAFNAHLVETVEAEYLVGALVALAYSPLDGVGLVNPTVMAAHLAHLVGFIQAASRRFWGALLSLASSLAVSLPACSLPWHLWQRQARLAGVSEPPWLLYWMWWTSSFSFEPQMRHL